MRKTVGETDFWRKILSSLLDKLKRPIQYSDRELNSQLNAGVWGLSGKYELEIKFKNM